MLTDLCQELKNWFNRNQPIINGTFIVQNGQIYFSSGTGILIPMTEKGLLVDQYYRIIGSVFNDGVHQYKETTDEELKSETFTGSVWFMAIPNAVLALNAEIDSWVGKYGESSTSPYSSESFGGYSYSKQSGGSANGSPNFGSTWQGVFKHRLNRWRKL